MILHDTATLKWTEVLDKLSPGGSPRTTVAGPIPCEINPIEAEQVIMGAGATGLVNIRYRFVTTIDLQAAAEAALAAFRANPEGRDIDGVRIGLEYDGKTLAVEGGFERHKILGRFHHIEAIMKDFGPLA